MSEPPPPPRAAEAEPSALLAGAERSCAWLQAFAAAVGLVIGGSNLAAWVLTPARALMVEWEATVMRLNTAFAITAAALSLALWFGTAPRSLRARAAQMLGGLVATIGGLTALQDIAGLNLGIDTLLGASTFVGDRAGAFVKAPGRMSFNAALALFFLGLALLGLEWRVTLGRWRLHLAPGCALLAVLPAALAMVGYVLGVSGFTGLLQATTILLHTAAALFLLALGVLIARPSRAPMRNVLSPGADGVLLRWMLPGTAGLLLSLGWVIGKGREARLVAPGEGTALMLYGGMVLLFILLAAASRAVARQEVDARRANLAQRVTEARNRAIIDTSLDAVLLMDAAGDVVDWNPAAERIFGWPRAEALGQELATLIIPEQLRAAHRRGLARFLQTGEGPVLGRRLELEAVRRDGTVFPVELAISPLFGGDTTVFVGFVRDITERRAAERELRELADAMPQIVWIAGPDGRTTFLNRRWFEFVGPDTAAESDWDRVLHPDDRPATAARWHEARLLGQPFEMRFRFRDATGANWRWFLGRAVPVRSAGGIVERWIGTCTDIDGLVRAEEAAQISSRAKDDFLAALSHELRTPLTPVLLTAGALREDPQLPLEVREQLRMIERNVALEARLIDDLLDLTRIAKGKLHLREETCDAHSLIGMAVEIVRDEAQRKELALGLELAAQRTVLRGDPSRLQQVFWNLLRNAIKFTPRGGRVTIATSDSPGDLLRIEVRDTGVGLAPEALEKIFRPFEQAGHETDHRGGGLGLGLAIARTVVEMHGGIIRAASPGLGFGTTFTIELPGASSLAPRVTFALTQHDAGAVPPLHLLLVEDHEPTIQVLARLLTRAGHKVVTSGTVATALAAAAAGKFDAVISDLGLPDGTGFDLMQKLRAEYGLRGIALSGYGMDQDLRRSREAGFITHLVKPVDFDQLRHALRELAPPSSTP